MLKFDLFYPGIGPCLEAYTFSINICTHDFKLLAGRGYGGIIHFSF